MLSFLSSKGKDDMLEFIVNNIPHKNGRCNGDAREKLVAVINALANPAGALSRHKLDDAKFRKRCIGSAKLRLFVFPKQSYV